MNETIDEKTMRCIRCGFCLDACPTFRLTGMETRGPRGRIYLIRSWRDGKIPPDGDVREALDTCLGCRACETACPSGVEYGSILEMARAQIEQAVPRSTMSRFARKQMLATLTSPGRMAMSLKAAGILKPLTHGKMPGFAARLLSGSSEASVALPSVDGEIEVHNLPERSPARRARRYVVGILEGCVMRVLFGGTNEATVRVLQMNDCDVVAPKAAGCCGALHLHTGYQEESLTRVRAMIDAFEPYIGSLDAIVVNSAGCGSTMKEYGELLAGDPKYAERAALFASKVRDVSEWLVEIGIEPPTKPLSAVVTYHEACHLAHGQRVRQQPRELLCSIPGLQLVELEESDTCCGSAEVYNITEPVLARRLLERKLDRIQATGATIVATGNPGCLSWLQQGARERGLNLRIAHPVELLDEAYTAAPKVGERQAEPLLR